jgi:hypothetical protein
VTVVVTGAVTIVQVTEVPPAGTVTVAGMEAIADAPLTTASVTTVSVGTAAEMVTLPTLDAPPISELGVSVRAVGVFAVTVSEADLVVPFAAAETETVVLADTELVSTMKFALLVPADTTTDAGMDFTADAPLVTVSVTVMLLLAVLTRVTVPVLESPPTTDDGENFRVLGTLGVTVNVAVTVLPFAVAETFTIVLALTELVTTVKFAVVLPARTVTDAGIDATAELPLVTAKATEVSDATAAFIVTVPVVESPPSNDVGENFRVLGTFGVTVKVLVTVVAFAVAETFTVVDEVTPLVATLKVAVEFPARTVTEAGIDETAELPLVTASVTGVSEVAGAAMVTVPTVMEPPTTEPGEKLSLLGIS